MRHLLSVASLSTLLLLSACSQDVTSTDASKDPHNIQAASTAGACTTAQSPAYLTASIDILMKVLTPNSQSAQSKWQTVLNDLAAGNVAAAQTDLNTLINFINLKYGQVNLTGVTITGPDGTTYAGAAAIGAFKDNLIAELTCYVQLNSFDLNPGDVVSKVFVNTDGSAGVYFPPHAVPQGYNVEITTPTTPLNTLLDQYPSNIDIQLKDKDGLPPPLGSLTGVPIVVVCFPSNIGSLVDDPRRLLLGHDASGGFELLPQVGVPQQLADAVACGTALTVETTALGRVVRKAADFFLPNKLYAMFFGAGGVGGSPEEFSPFGAVDPGLAVGGAGGSPEEFAPAMSPTAGISGPMNSTMSGGGTTVTGTADEPNVTNPAQLPKVRVNTPTGTGINGVSVTFELFAPDANLFPAGIDNITEPTSNAALCGAGVVNFFGRFRVTVPTVNDVTLGDGYASVPCLNFGTVPGYKNLKATFDPTGVDSLACIINAAGACATATTSSNFLVETTPGVPTRLVVIGSPGSTSAVAGVAMNAQPVLEVQDGSVSHNPVILTSALTLTAVTVTNSDGTPCTKCDVSSFTPTWDLAAGRVTLSGLALGGEVTKTYKLTFGSGSLTPATALVTVSGAGAADKIEAIDPSGGIYPLVTYDAFAAVSPNPTARVRDKYDNTVAGAGVAWVRTDALLGGSISAPTPAAGTGSNGQSYAVWTLGKGDNALEARLSSLAPATFSAHAAADTLAACTVSGSQKKIDLAKYTSGISGYLGNLSILVPLGHQGSIRSAELAMSVTGQSSGTGGYTTSIRAYRLDALGAKILPAIATGAPYNASNPSDQTLRIPGDNGSPAPIRFNLVPTSGINAAVVGSERVAVEVQVTAPSTRTFQVWYNTRTVNPSTCYESKVFAAGVTNFITGTATRGVSFNIRNFKY